MTDLADAVAAIAREAGAVALRRQSEDFRRWEKTPGTPVCEVDLEIDQLLRQRLSALLPEAAWLSEETLDSPERLKANRLWVVDPIDGTRDYVRGRPGWAISIALIESGRPVIGILDAPARAEHWRAEIGGGATRNGTRLQVTPRTQLAGARVPTDQLSAIDADLVIVAKPNSIALRIAMVAAGEADLLATLRWGNEWDIAAAALIAREAGACVTDALGDPLGFNTPGAQAFGILATAPGIHHAARERLRKRAEDRIHQF